jgi:fumarate reductase flavoprotein subunit
MSKLRADVIVVAAGASGLAAAIAAAECGASVLAFEKGSTTGGTGSMAMGPFGVESRLQKLGQMGPDRDEAFRLFMDYTHWRVDARLVRAYIDKAAGTIDWLEAMGVEFADPATYFPGGQFTWHIVKPAAGGEPGPACASTMTKIMTDRAKELGVKILLQTPVTKLVKREGRITGVMAEDRAGEPVEAEAGAVVVATGGFGDNPQMIKKHIGYEWGKDLASFRIPGMVGDGLRMAWEAGAAASDMNMEIIFHMPGEPQPELQETFRQPHLMVNLAGRRFVDEGIMPNSTFTGNAIARQKERTAYLIFDGSLKDHMQTAGFDNVHRPFPFTKVGDLDALIDQARAQGYQDVHRAPSLEELAAQTGIDPAGLAATVEEYNGFCARGYDPVFNKSHRLLRALLHAPYYAAKFLPGGYGTLGGIKINHRTEVLDKEWNPIPGLYAAGTDACSIYGDSYVFILPGNTLGFALNSGRLAGENAAARALAA